MLREMTAPVMNTPVIGVTTRTWRNGQLKERVHVFTRQGDWMKFHTISPELGSEQGLIWFLGFLNGSRLTITDAVDSIELDTRFSALIEEKLKQAFQTLAPADTSMPDLWTNHLKNFLQQLVYLYTTSSTYSFIVFPVKDPAQHIIEKIVMENAAASLDGQQLPS